MKRIKFLVYTLIFIIPVISLKGQDIEFTASAPSTVSQGETFQITYRVNAKGDKFKGPDFKGFDVVSGPNVSQSSSFQFINGKMSQSNEQIYTYLIHASEAGTFDIKPASIVVDGKTYYSNALRITIEKSATSSTPKSSTKPRSTPATPTEPIQSAGDLSQDDIFVKAYVNKSNPYVGEQVIITYKLYTKVPLANIRINNLGTFPGFWSQDLIKSDQLQQSTEIINGQEYVTAEIKKSALFPLKSGTFKIPPLEMEATATLIKQRKRFSTGDPFFDQFFNDAFFNTGYDRINKKVYSNAVTINAKPLPTAGRPVDFGSAVGNFKFSAQIDRNQLKTNEALNLKVTISGSGNLDMVEAPNISFPTEFDTYDPKVNSNISTSSSGISGTKTFEYLIIPRTPGKYIIKPFTFSYFNPSTGRYYTETSPEFTIEVLKGADQPGGITYSGVNQQDIKYIGTDIRYIKLPPYHLRPIGVTFFASKLYYGILIGLIVLFGLFTFGIKTMQKRRGDVGLMRLRKATSVATKRLKTAHAYLKNQQEAQFYNEISAALWGYISDKFNIPLAELSMENVENKLLKKNVNPQTIKAFIDTLNNCEFARFAPGNKSENMEQVYKEALSTISRIEQELK